VALRFPRGTVSPLPGAQGLATGARWLTRHPAPKLTFVTLGPLGLAAVEAALELPVSVLDARWLEPLDEPALTLASATPLVTVEEGTVRGGLGSAVLEWAARVGRPAPVRVLGLPAQEFIRHGEARAQRHALGLDAAGLRQVALELLSR
jgi:1-deoxy-D-xylulose-5-phosphate synthase